MSTTNKIYFGNAPIKEAVCTFNFKGKLQDNEVDDLVKRLKSSNNPYELSEKQPIISVQFVSKPTFVETVSRKIKNPKGDKIVQVDFNSISIHQLGKYTKWGDFSKQIIQVLRELDKKMEIHNITLKKINSFIIPSNESPFEYFNYYPEFKNKNYFDNRNLNQLVFHRKLKEHSFILLKFINRLIPEKYQNIIIDITTNINLTKERIYTGDIDYIKESLSFHNNELYKSFVSTLKQKAKDSIK